MRSRLFDETYWANPHEVTAYLRQQAPVHAARLPNGLRVWVIGRYAHARAALLDSRLAKHGDAIRRIVADQLAAAGHPPTPHLMFQGGLIFTEGPAHARVKRLISAVFSPRNGDQLRAHVAAVASTFLPHLDALPPDQPVDIMAEFAAPVPLMVLAELLGVPDVDRDALRAWTSALMVEEPETAGIASVAMGQYVAELVEAKRSRPAEDLLSALIRAEDDAGGLTPEDVLYNVVLLLVAGHETTTNAIGSALVELLDRPARWRALAENPVAIPGVVDELLRLASPARHATYRYTTEPVEIDGTTIPADELVLVSLASANRDPRQFPGADTFVPERPPAEHLAFGHGRHYCVGAALARTELAVVLDLLISRYSAAQLAVPRTALTWSRSPVMLGYQEVPVWLKSSDDLTP